MNTKWAWQSVTPTPVRGEHYILSLCLGIPFREFGNSSDFAKYFGKALGLIVEILYNRAMNDLFTSDQTTKYVHHEKNNRLAPVLPFGTNNLW